MSVDGDDDDDDDGDGHGHGDGAGDDDGEADFFPGTKGGRLGLLRLLLQLLIGSPAVAALQLGGGGEGA